LKCFCGLGVSAIKLVFCQKWKTRAYQSGASYGILL